MRTAGEQDRAAPGAVAVGIAASVTPAAAEDQPGNGVPGMVEDQGAAATAGAGTMEGGTRTAVAALAAHPRGGIEEEEEGLEPMAMEGAVRVVVMLHHPRERGGTEERSWSLQKCCMCEMWGIRLRR